MTPNPATISDALNSKLNDLFSELTGYMSKDDELFVELYAEADRLGKASGAERSIALVRLFALAGDREQAEYYLKNARRLNIDAEAHDLAQITALLSLGYFSEAIPTIEACGEPERNLLNLFIENPPVNGLFHLIEGFHRTAKAMNLTNTPDHNEYREAAIAIMDSWGDTDAEYSAVLDIAGEILRERRLFLGKSGLTMEPVPAPLDGAPPYVKLAFCVFVDLETSIDMTCEFSERLARSRLKIPQSLIFEFIAVEQQQ